MRMIPIALVFIALYPRHALQRLLPDKDHPVDVAALSLGPE